MSLVAALLEIAGVALVFPLLYLLVEPDAVRRFRMVEEASVLLGLDTRRDLYAFLIASIAIVVVAKGAYMAAFYNLQMRTLAGWKVALSHRLMQMYLFSDFSIHLRKTSSEIIRNISLVSTVYDQFAMSCVNILTNATIATGLVLLLLLVLPLETTLGVSILAASTVGLYVLLRRHVLSLGEESAVLFKVRQRLLQQSVGAFRETKILGKEAYFADRFSEVERRAFANQRHYSFAALVPSLVLEAVVILSLLGIITYILFVAGEPSVALATLGVVGGAMFRLAPQFNRILGAMQMLNLSKHTLEIIAGELEELEAGLYIPPPGLGRLPLTSGLRLDHVSFRYPAAQRPAVTDVSLEIRSNEFVGITGPSGAGKTTLLAILIGLLRPTEGAVLVDGIPLQGHERLRMWQNSIGYVSQSTFLVEDSILRNIAYGVDDADINEARAREAVRLAQLEGLVERQPQGIDENVGEHGSRLSGGERQRIGIARALYIEPSFLAFDEATSALDVATERAVTLTVLGLRGRQTIVTIAHRLSTLRDCDRIVMMDAGRVVGVDAFDELEASCPPFRRLVELSQLRKDGLIADVASPALHDVAAGARAE
ncbi:MAG: ABC transporter ATP-binding protein [Vicinamibacteria bacterium]